MLGVLALAAVVGCDSSPCIETLTTPEKALHGLPGMLVAYAIAWAGLDAARFILRSPETGAGRVAGICALGVGTAGLAGIVQSMFPLVLGVVLACIVPMVWVQRMVRAAQVCSGWRIAGALACTAVAGVLLGGLAIANVDLVIGAGRICAPTGTVFTPTMPGEAFEAEQPSP